MAYVICQPCIGTKDTSCVSVCPSDAIHPTPSESGFSTTDQLFIDPARCVDCGFCAAACPVTAIFPSTSVPSQWHSFIAKNANHFT
ncbi:MAG TPA: 4Fe-4S binding protein [Tepidisphaeraceae bacterium]|nr:4Fe-4S binding protein [Tepidisphaeraceae bacterium]